MTILDNYMFRPLLAIFRLSLRELKVLLYNVRARDGEICTHTTGMTYFQNSDSNMIKHMCNDDIIQHFRMCAYNCV